LDVFSRKRDAFNWLEFWVAALGSKGDVLVVLPGGAVAHPTVDRPLAEARHAAEHWNLHAYVMQFPAPWPAELSKRVWETIHSRARSIVEHLGAGHE
jgi:hypothetical protein